MLVSGFCVTVLFVCGVDGFCVTVLFVCDVDGFCVTVLFVCDVDDMNKCADELHSMNDYDKITKQTMAGVDGELPANVDVNALAAADVDKIEEIVRPCGLGKSKARDISACMKILRDEYDGGIPNTFEELLKLPGVGRKSANLIMGDVFGEPAIVTDTHCIRLVNRIGLVKDLKEPKKVEMELWKIIPPQEGSDFCHRLVYHGRDVCTARTKPHCERCCLEDICKKAGVK